MKKASSLLVPALLLGLSAAIVQSCASGETDPAYSGGGSGGDSGDGDGGVSGDGSGGNASSSGGSNGTSSGGSPASSGGVTGSSSGGRVGSGGSSTSSGGKTGSGGAKTGGTTGTSSGGKTGSGGTTTSGSGGMIITSSGGTTGSMTCTKQDATMTVNNGMATNGKWSGYAYTYTGSTGMATITPVCGTTGTCFMTAGKQLCVSGSVGPDPNFTASAGFGWDIGAMSSSGTAGRGGSSSSTAMAILPGGSGLSYTVPGITTDMRFQVTDGSSTHYCAKVPTNNSGTVPWSSFTQQCYNPTPGAAYSASSTPIVSVEIVIPALSGSMANSYCFCVVNLGPAT